MTLPKDVLDLDIPRNCFLKVEFLQKADTPWAKAGHLIARYQTELEPSHSPAGQIPAPVASPPSQPLKISTSALEYRISTSNTTVTFDRVRGQVSSWTFNDKAILSRDESSSSSSSSSSPLPSPLLALDFWRAPTDNDAAWQSAEWKRYGLHMMTSRLRSFTLSEEAGSVVMLKAHHALAPPSLAWHFNAETTYTIRGGSSDKSDSSSSSSTAQMSVAIHTRLTPHGGHPPNLPRVGHTVQLARGYTQVSWFGRGPEESYNDKQASQAMGIYGRRIAHMATHYEVPQENGNRCTVRWCQVSSELSSASLATAATSSLPAIRATYIPGPGERENFQFATPLHSAATLEAAKHPCDLLDEGQTRTAALWRLDADVAGVGTAACGPGTEPAAQVECRAREWTVVLEVRA